MRHRNLFASQMRTYVAGWALLALVLLLIDSALAVSAEPAQPPSIVLIVADDLGYGDLGCYGQQWIKTPRIDELAQQGIRFTQFYCGAPVCAPSRCTLMTGKHTGHAAIRDNRAPKGLEKVREQFAWESPGQTPLPESEVTIAELLRANGYTTAAIGKWGLGMPGTKGETQKQGFDLFYGYYCQAHAHNHYPEFLWRDGKKESLPGNDGTATGQTFSQDRFTEEAVSFLKDHHDKPFLLYLPFTIPHLSIQVPEDSLAQYKGVIPEAPYQHTAYYQHATPRAGYAAMITRMDAAVGKIVDTLNELGVAENTLVIFTSDNGPVYDRLGGTDSDFFNSAGPLRGRKGSVYEGGIRAPFIARWPGHIKPGSVTPNVSSFWDVLPTLCDITKADKPQNLDGVSFTETLFDKGEQRQHKFLYWEFPSYGVQQAIRSGDWKAVRRGLDRGDTPFELYDLATDESEQHDVAAEHPDVIRRLSDFAAKAHSPSNLFPLFAAEREKAEPAKPAAAPARKSAAPPPAKP